MFRLSHGARAAAAFLALPALAAAQDARPAAAAAPRPDLATAPPVTPLPSDSAVRAGTLPNGLRYYVRRNAKPEHRAELRLVVDAGSVLEDSTQRGLAHLLEHMAFNGTRHFEKQALVHYLERVGMRFGPDVNAYTGFDETVYMLTLPTDSADVLATGVQILGDWAHEITLDSAEVVRERPVVMEEWRLGQGAESRIRDRQLPVIFRGSRYAVRLPIGDTTVIRHATAEQVRRFYETWYRPELMAVVAVGDFDAAAVERLIRERFSALRNPADAPPRPTTPVPGNAEPLVSIVTDPEATSTVVSVLYKRDPAPSGTVADVRREIVAALYDRMLNLRLYELTQRPDAPFLGAGSSEGRFVRAKDAYSLGAAVADSGVLRGLEALLVEAARVDRHGFTASELERARADLLRGMERSYAEREKTVSAAFANQYVTAFLQAEPYLSTADAWTLYQRFVPGVTLADVNALASEYISDSNRVVLLTAPARADVQLPTERELLATFDRVRTMDVAAYEDDVADAPLVAEPPRGGRVTDTRRVADVGITEWTLSNGVRVLVKPTHFKDDQVLLAARSPGGTSLAPDSTYVSASLASSIAELGGVGAFDAVQLEKALAGKAVSAGPTIGELTEGMSGSASPKDVEQLFQLVYLYFTAPREDSAAFAAFQARARSALENRGRDPQSAFADTLGVTLTQHHPRARPATPAMLGEIDLGTALRFYHDRYADASDFTFAIVGNVDTASLRPLVERWLGGLPSTGRTERWRDVGIRAPDGVVKRVVRRGVEPKAETRLVFHGPAQYSRQQQYAIAALTQVLETRLRETLREAMGGTYDASVGGSLSREPREEYAISVSFGSAPERLDELTAAVLREIDSLKTTGPRAEELASAQEQLRRSMETGLEQNGFWLSQMLTFDEQGVPLTEIPQARRLVDALTPAVLQEAARRYFDTTRYVQVSLLPEH
jgi:zinc protease